MEKVETKPLFEENKREYLILTAKNVIERAKIERDYVFDTSQWRDLAPRVKQKN